MYKHGWFCTLFVVSLVAFSGILADETAENEVEDVADTGVAEEQQVDEPVEEAPPSDEMEESRRGPPPPIGWRTDLLPNGSKGGLFRKRCKTRACRRKQAKSGGWGNGFGNRGGFGKPGRFNKKNKRPFFWKFGK